MVVDSCTIFTSLYGLFVFIIITFTLIITITITTTTTIISLHPVRTFSVPLFPARSHHVVTLPLLIHQFFHGESEV